jgi:hypothetical protein
MCRPLLSVPRSLAFIAWWSLGTVASRVIIVWGPRTMVRASTEATG